MATLLGSPGVSTNEIDQSFVEVGAPGVGAVAIGVTSKGPAFVPVTVQNNDGHVAKFGGFNPDYQLPYLARNYLLNSNSMTTVRVLGHRDGTGVSNGYTLGGITGIADVSGTNSVTGSVLAVIHHSGTIGVVSVNGVALDANNFVVTLGSYSVTASFQTSSANYIEKVLNTDPTKYGTVGHYLAEVYKYQKPATSASWYAVALQSASWRSFDRDFEGSVTPWVKSQLVGGREFNLFRFWTRSDGRASNDEIKLSIVDIKPSVAPSSTPFGTFGIAVRKFDDTDQRPQILESWASLTMDPTSPNYVLRRIGDMLEVFDTNQRKFVVTAGSFPNKSKYIRVEMNTDEEAPDDSLPWGFRGYQKILFSGSNVGGKNIVPALPYTPSLKDNNGSYTPSVYWGLSFVSGGIVDRMRAFPDQPTNDAWMTGSDPDFSMRYLSGAYETGQIRYYYNTAATDAYAPIYSSGSVQKFTLAFAGGHDGWDIRTRNPLALNNSDPDTTHAVISAKRAVDTIANPDFVDYKILAIPSVNNLVVTDYARQMIRKRKDAFFVMDITGSSVQSAIDNLKAREIDDNYCGTYYPDLRMNDKTNNRMVRVCPSVAVVGTYAYNDRVAKVHFAPAGIGRGGLKMFDIEGVIDRLDHDDRDNLYDNRINPIATFPEEGIVVFGQKTMQLKQSSLDRINVRRLLIDAKKIIATVAKGLVFEPNDPSTWLNFTNKVNPILDRIRQDHGLVRFRVVMDSTTTTDSDIDRNAMNGKIFLEPTKAAEFISIDFVITSAGVSFSG